MTENEAKKLIAKFCEDRMNFARGKDMSDKELDDFCKFSDALNLSISSLEEIQQYRAIGTVEEFREGRERQIPKKPMRIRLLETSGVHCRICPICKNPVYADLSNKNHIEYCGHCGQAIDWSENNGE